MPPKLGRVPSIRERVEDTLSEHRNELVALLSRSFIAPPSLFLLCLLATMTNSRRSCSCFCCMRIYLAAGRYMGQGKGILQPHHLLDEFSSVIAEDRGRKLEDGPFFEVLKTAQVCTTRIRHPASHQPSFASPSLSHFCLVRPLQQEAIVLPPFVAIAVRPRPGVWEYVRVNVYELSVEQLSVSEYLGFKEELVDGQ